MDIKGKVVAITGAGGGIGRAMAEAFANAGARHVVVTDLDASAASEVARNVGGSSFACDVSREADLVRVIFETEKNIGAIDIFCSNAGILPINPDLENAASSPDVDWQRAWQVNVMAHVHAARALLPAMIARRSGYFLNTVSAAGLLSQIGSAAYATTKHAAIGFAENLAITHKDHGIVVSVLCPQAVGTKMIEGKPLMGADVDGILSAEQVAQAAIDGVLSERFLILPHPSVATYFAKKSESYDRWLGGMAKLRRSVMRPETKA
jgi:NAD(P)-dependent dehydrogenase (short-subunit alcohol dehydrogenase family)